jgi:hypothetical protein
MLAVDIIEECLHSLVFVVSLQFLHLGQLDIVDTLADPFVPIHTIIRIELDAP